MIFLNRIFLATCAFIAPTIAQTLAFTNSFDGIQLGVPFDLTWTGDGTVSSPNLLVTKISRLIRLKTARRPHPPSRFRRIVTCRRLSYRKYVPQFSPSFLPSP